MPTTPAVDTGKAHPDETRAAGIATDIATAVVRGDWRTGELLPSEGSLSKQYGVSRASIREALRRLGAAGLVETRHGIGSFVQPSAAWQMFDHIVLRAHLESGRLPDIARELIELRQMMEVTAAGLAATRMTSERLEALTLRIGQLDAALADPETFAKADVMLHDAIIEASANRFIQGMASFLADLLTEARRMTAHAGEVSGRERAQQDHKRVLKALEEHDAEAARAAMLLHMRHTEEDVRHALLSRLVEEHE